MPSKKTVLQTEIEDVIQMTNKQHVEGILNKLEKDFGADIVYNFFSGMYDVTVLEHSSNTDDNPHLMEAGEVIQHQLYEMGAQAAEKLMDTINKVNK